MKSTMKFSILLLLGALIERATLLYGLDCNAASSAEQVACFDVAACSNLNSTISMDDAYRHSVITDRVENCDDVKENIKNVEWYGRLVSCESEFSGRYGVFFPSEAGETGVCFRACIKDTAMNEVMTKIHSVLAKAEGWRRMIYTDAGVDLDGNANEDAIADMVDIDVACGYLKAKHMTDPIPDKLQKLEITADGTVMQNRNKVLIAIRQLRELYPTTIGNLMKTHPCSWCHPMMYWCKITKATAEVGFCSAIPCNHMSSIVGKHFGSTYSCVKDTSDCDDTAHKALVIQNIVMALGLEAQENADFAATLHVIPTADAGSGSVTQNCFINFEGAMYHKNMSKEDCEKVRQFTVKTEHLEHRNDAYHNLLLLGKLKKVTGSDLYFRSTETCPKGLYYSYGPEGSKVKFCSTGDENVHNALKVMFTTGGKEQPNPDDPTTIADLISYIDGDDALHAFVMNIAKYVPDLWEEIGKEEVTVDSGCTGAFSGLDNCLKPGIEVTFTPDTACNDPTVQFDIKKGDTVLLIGCADSTTSDVSRKSDLSRQRKSYLAVKFAEIPHYTVEVNNTNIVPAGVEDLIRIQT